ncbi:glycosyltransferase [Patescibacteria group bacterium]|nr:glycosyltransferase [Patescibacteria group bacterium]
MNKSLLIVGNHHTPAIELVRQIKQDKNISWSLIYVSHLHSRELHIKNTIVKKLKVKFYSLKSSKFDRYHLASSILSFPDLISAIRQSLLLLKKAKPNLVISFGGYSSVPLVFAAFLKAIPVIIHEQTPTFGLSTKINSIFAKKIALSYPPSASLFSALFKNKIVVTGNLLRFQIYQNSTKNYQHLILKIKQKPLLYITGGSQGCETVNQNILPILPKLTQKYLIIHHTGVKHLDSIKKQSSHLKNYYPTNYVGLEDIGWVLQNASIIISRAGANTCQEITALKKNALLIPLPKSSQDEQNKNALLVKKNLPQTIILPQDKLTSSQILISLNQLARYPLASSFPPQKNNLKILKLIHSLV